MTVSLYDVALFLHIAAAIHLVGTSAISPLIVSRIHAATTRAELLSWLGFMQRAMRGNPPTALVLLASGVYLGSQGWWSTGWFYVSVFAWVLSSILAAGVIKPAAGRLARAAAAVPAAPIDADLEAMRHARGWTLAEKVMLGSDVAILWIMVAKPAAVESIVIFAALTGIFAGASALRKRPIATPATAAPAA